MSGKPGMITRAPLAPHEARARIWRSIRQMRRFSTADICAAAEVGPSNAKKYLRSLRLAGYLRCVRERDSGRTGGHAVYQLLRDTGPHAPRRGKQGLIDPNLVPAKPDPGQELVSITRAEYGRAMKCLRACAGMADPEFEVSELRRRAAYGTTTTCQEGTSE